MNRFIGVALFGLFPMTAVEAFAADAFEPPEWAYPLMEEGRGRGPDDGTLYTVEGSDLELTQTEINNRYNPPDWYPGEHPPNPRTLRSGDGRQGSPLTLGHGGILQRRRPEVRVLTRVCGPSRPFPMGKLSTYTKEEQDSPAPLSLRSATLPFGSSASGTSTGASSQPGGPVCRRR